ncbi:MAG: ParA family protein [Holophagales bacterium]|jgi:chromosome partitioning protein|nr:ParA family protein [Holophagales bacterium]
MSAKIVALANQKGGVGKTTSAINIAASLAMLEKLVLLVDFDPQGHSTTGLGFRKPDHNAGSYALIKGAPIESLVLTTEVPMLRVVPAGKDLAQMEFELFELPQLQELRNALQPVIDHYDYILIDSPPALGMITLNALTAADEVIVPMPCEFFAMDGLAELAETIRRIQAGPNPKLVLGGILLTMAEERTNLGEAVASEVRQAFPGKVFQTSIPRNIRLAEAPSHGKPVAFYDLKSKGAQAYLNLAREWIGLEFNVSKDYS